MTAVFYAQRFNDAHLRSLLYNLAFGLLPDEHVVLRRARHLRRNRYILTVDHFNRYYRE